ncbi:MAG: hypothetical protein ACKVN9_07090 [Methylophilaceae bacterium]
MESNKLKVSVGRSGIFVTGEWTIPIPLEQARMIFEGDYQHSANDGLFSLSPASDKTCLSLLPVDVAKIALTQSDIDQLKSILKTF